MRVPVRVVVRVVWKGRIWVVKRVERRVVY